MSTFQRESASLYARLHETSGYIVLVCIGFIEAPGFINVAAPRLEADSCATYIAAKPWPVWRWMTLPRQGMEALSKGSETRYEYEYRVS